MSLHFRPISGPKILQSVLGVTYPASPLDPNNININQVNSQVNNHNPVNNNDTMTEEETEEEEAVEVEARFLPLKDIKLLHVSGQRGVAAVSDSLGKTIILDLEI